MSIFGVTDTPISDFWCRLLWVSKPKWAVLFTLSRDVCDIPSLRFISGMTPLPVYMASMAASHFPHMCVRAETGCQTRTGDLPLSSQTC